MPFVVVTFEIRDCCGENADAQQLASNILLQNQTEPPQGGTWIRQQPLITGWTYTDEGGTIQNGYIDWIAVRNVDGNFTDYASARVDTRALDGDNNFLGDLVLEVHCRDICYGKSHSFIQTAGVALEPFRTSSYAYLSTYCGEAISLGANQYYSWGIPIGETATLTTIGGFGDFRRFTSSDTFITGPGGVAINNVTWRYDGFDSEIALSNTQVAQFQAEAEEELYTEANLTFGEMASVEIEGNKPGTQLVWCTDGVACTWGVFVTAECSLCDNLNGSEPTTEPTQKGPHVPRNDDYRIKRGGTGWMKCESMREIDSPIDVPILGGDDDNDRSGAVLNRNQADEGAILFSGDVYLDHQNGGGGVTNLRPITKQQEFTVGSQTDFPIPPEIRTGNDGNDIRWKYQILNKPPLPDNGENPDTLWGGGWGLGGTGPQMSSNNDRKLWRITKKKNLLKVRAKAPTNHLPTTILIHPYIGGKAKQRYAYSVPPSLKNQIQVLTATSSGQGDRDFRSHDVYTYGTTTISETEYVYGSEIPRTTPSRTSCGLIAHFFAFCPSATWTFETRRGNQNNRKVKIKIELTNVEDQSQVRHLGFPEFDGEILAAGSNYYNMDADGEKEYDLNDLQYERKDLIRGLTIGAIWYPEAENRLDNNHPFQGGTVHLLDDDNKAARLALKGNEGTIGLFSPYHKPGGEKDKLKSDFKDYWFGVYEPLRGCNCTWGSDVIAIDKNFGVGHNVDTDIKLLTNDTTENRPQPEEP